MGQGNAKADGKLDANGNVINSTGGGGGGNHPSQPNAIPDATQHSSAKPILKPKQATAAGAHNTGAGGTVGSAAAAPVTIGVESSHSGSGSGNNSLDAGAAGGGGAKAGVPMIGGPTGGGGGDGGLTPSSLTDRVARIISKEAAAQQQSSTLNGMQLSLGSSGLAGSLAGGSPKLDDLLLVPEPKQIETVSTLFKWSGGGTEVFLTGSFNHWQGKIRMIRQAAGTHTSSSASGAVSVSGGPSPSTSTLALSSAAAAAAGDKNNTAAGGAAAMNSGDSNAAGSTAASAVEFVLVIDIPPGVHQYKYIVDEQWRINADAPTTTNPQGVVNNIIEVKRPVFEDNLSAFADSDEEELDENKQKINYGQRVPAPDEYSKDPPKIPPQLGNILLNAPVSPADPYVLPIPQHVTLNHMYVYGYGKNPGESEVLVTGITQRFKTKSFINNTPKFVTTVYYQKLGV